MLFKQEPIKEDWVNLINILSTLSISQLRRPSSHDQEGYCICEYKLECYKLIENTKEDSSYSLPTQQSSNASATMYTQT